MYPKTIILWVILHFHPTDARHLQTDARRSKRAPRIAYFIKESPSNKLSDARRSSALPKKEGKPQRSRSSGSLGYLTAFNLLHGAIRLQYSHAHALRARALPPILARAYANEKWNTLSHKSDIRSSQL